mmetsp:Transcript_9630/g.8478  ORF Transcript_9630/g.8478 Transcript_9630/m.8478 type:complete len:428 (-) Transcript_9630:281-1564(-)
MSTVAIKRSKVSHDTGYQIAQFPETNSREDNSRDEEDQPQQCKSDQEETPESQEIQRSTRGSGVGRTRKKKVFADYYYGDEIFPKSKNGNKKKTNEKKIKTGKVRGKYKTQKRENNDEQRKVAQKKTYKKAKRTINSNTNFKTSELTTPNNGAFKNGPLLGNKLIKESSFTNYGHDFQPLNPSLDSFRGLANNLVADNKIYPVKPIPQRQGGSKLDLLLNAYKMSNTTKITPNPVLDETLKRREEKALDKQVQNILSNSENPLKMNPQSMGLGSVQDTLNAILSRGVYPPGLNLGMNNSSLLQNSSEGRKSSSEIEENLKHKTPVKIKQRKVYGRDDYSSSQENNDQEPQYLIKKTQSFVMSTPKKNNNYQAKEKETSVRVSRVKTCLQEGDKIKLLIDSNNDFSSNAITLNIGSKNVLDDFKSDIS